MKEHIVRIARAAGTAIMNTRAHHTEIKADGSPVTAADRAAHEIIVRELAKISNIPIISEEGALPDIIPEEFWLVDPLDGTRELLKDSGEFTVNIALIQSARPVLGVVDLPAHAVTYAADESGSQVIRNGSERRIQVAAVPSPVRICVSRDHVTAEDESIISKFEGSTRLPAGSSLKLCLVAEGTADLYVRAGNTMEWDIGAAHAILTGAGGVIRTLAGDELRYGKPGLLNPGFVAASREALIDEACA